jgi:hypothetical protein
VQNLGTAQNLPAEGKIMVKRRENRIDPISHEDQSRNHDEASDQARSERPAPLFSERERQIMRLYNPATGKCDLTEEEATKREACDQAVSEELQRRRQERLTAWEAGVGLDKEAKHALGKLNAPAAWFLIVDRATTALELNPEGSQQLAEEMNLFDQPDDPLQLHDFEDLREVVVGMNPVRGINHFHYINPQANLQAVDKMKPLEVLRGVLLIFTKSDLWAATHGD